MLKFKDKIHLLVLKKKFVESNGQVSISNMRGVFTPNEWNHYREVIDKEMPYELKGDINQKYVKLINKSTGASWDVLSGMVEEFIDYSGYSYICEQFTDYSDMTEFINERLKEGFVISKTDINEKIVELKRTLKKESCKVN